MSTLNELQEQRFALEAKIVAELAASRAQALQDAKALVALHGFVVSDLFASAKASTRKPRSDAGKPRGPRKPKPLAIAA